MSKESNEKNCNGKKSFTLKRRQLPMCLRRLGSELLCNKLVICGERVIIPANAEIKVKIKYEHDGKNVLTIQAEWEQGSGREKSSSCHHEHRMSEDLESDDD